MSESQHTAGNGGSAVSAVVAFQTRPSVIPITLSSSGWHAKDEKHCSPTWRRSSPFVVDVAVHHRDLVEKAHMSLYLCAWEDLLLIRSDLMVLDLRASKFTLRVCCGIY